jgi:hypothetical protein
MAKRAEHLPTTQGKMRTGRILQTRVQISSRDILTSKTPYGRVNLKSELRCEHKYFRLYPTSAPSYPPNLSCQFSAFLAEFAEEPLVADI